MIPYSNIDDLWFDAVQTAVAGDQLPSRDGPTREVLGFVARLSDPRANFLFNPTRKINPSYAAAELLWILSGQRVVHALIPYAPQYVRFCNEGELIVDDHMNEARLGTNQHGMMTLRNMLYAHGAYGSRLYRRFGGLTALENVVGVLRVDRESRQVVVPLYDAGLDTEKAVRGDKRDIPCTLAMHFLLRDNKLYLSVNMRSNDVWLGLPHDIWVFTCIQQLVAECLRCGLGWYQHSATSLHLYDRDYSKVSNLTHHRGSPVVFGRHSGSNFAVEMFEHIRFAVDCEVKQRATGKVSPLIDSLGTASLLKHLMLMTTLKWSKDKKSVAHMVPSEPLATYMEEYWC